MKQHLRSLFMLLMLVVWASGSFAQEKTYSYTFVRGGVFTKATQTKIFNNISWDFATQGKTFQFDGNLNAFRVGSKSTPANEITFTTKDFAGTIKSVSIEGKNDNDKGNAKVYVTVGGTTYNSTKQAFTTNFDRYTLTGSSSGTLQIKITCTGKSAVIIKTITVVYEEASTSLTLNEDADDTNTKIEKNKGKTQDVALTRTLVANKWNTFCVPFETEIAGTALEGATVKTIGTIKGNVINLVNATKIEAGVPYLVKPTTGNIENPTFKGVTISVTTPVEKGNDEYKFVGTYSPKTIFDKDFGKIWGVTADGKLAKINANTTMKGLRAYFVFPVNVAAKLNFDGETTGINNIETNAAVNGKVYNLNGQYVGNSLNGLKKGIYVVNGKKVIK